MLFHHTQKVDLKIKYLQRGQRGYGVNFDEELLRRFQTFRYELVIGFSRSHLDGHNVLRAFYFWTWLFHIP